MYNIAPEILGLGESENWLKLYLTELNGCAELNYCQRIECSSVIDLIIFHFSLLVWIPAFLKLYISSMVLWGLARLVNTNRAIFPTPEGAVLTLEDLIVPATLTPQINWWMSPLSSNPALPYPPSVVPTKACIQRLYELPQHTFCKLTHRSQLTMGVFFVQSEETLQNHHETHRSPWISEQVQEAFQTGVVKKWNVS